MKEAFIVITVCEIIRTGIYVTNIIFSMIGQRSLNNRFIESLKKDNKEWARGLLEDFLREHGEDDLK